MIPDFRDDGYLPEGLHAATEADATFRFGSGTPRRRRLILRLRRWLELSRLTQARRFLVDGSFVTAKEEPNDIDAVVLLADDFQGQISDGSDAALEMEEMLLTRRPEEIFAAEDTRDWNDWVDSLAGLVKRMAAQGTLGDSFMITNAVEYEKAEEELRDLERRLERVQQSNPMGSKGFTKAGIRKMIARIHEELAVYEGSEEARRPQSR